MEGRIDGPGPDREAAKLSDEENTAFWDIIAWECHPEHRRQVSRAFMDIKRNPGPSVINWFLARTKEMWRT